MSEQPVSLGTDARVQFETALAAAKPSPIDIGGDEWIYTLLAPYGSTVEVIDPEEYLDRPRRPHGTAHVQTVESFIEYTQRHFDTDMTTVWVDMDRFVISALLNDHEGAGEPPGWGDHRAQLALILTPEWQHWAGKDGTLMAQAEFAEHIEDGVAEIQQPDAATMLEVAQTFQAKTAAQFRQATRLDNGATQFQYDEEVTAKAGTSGQMEVPTTMTLGIAPFLGEQPYEVGARIRYRLSGGTLRIGYKLDRPERVIRDALTQIADRLRGEFPATFIGQPRT